MLKSGVRFWLAHICLWGEHCILSFVRPPNALPALCRKSARGPLAALFHMTSEAFMFSFRPMKRWQGFALLLLTIQAPAFAEGIDLQNTRSFQGGPINNETVSQLRVKW